MVKFAANNNKSTFTKLSPFFAIKDFYPRMSFDIVDHSNTNTYEQIFKQKALDISGKMKTIWEFIQKALAAAQQNQSKQTDKHWKDITYAIGVKV